MSKCINQQLDQSAILILAHLMNEALASGNKLGLRWKSFTLGPSDKITIIEQYYSTAAMDTI